MMVMKKNLIMLRKITEIKRAFHVNDGKFEDGAIVVMIDIATIVMMMTIVKNLLVLATSPRSTARRNFFSGNVRGLGPPMELAGRSDIPVWKVEALECCRGGWGFNGSLASGGCSAGL